MILILLGVFRQVLKNIHPRSIYYRIIILIIIKVLCELLFGRFLSQKFAKATLDLYLEFHSLFNIQQLFWVSHTAEQADYCCIEFKTTVITKGSSNIYCRLPETQVLYLRKLCTCLPHTCRKTVWELVIRLKGTAVILISGHHEEIDYSKRKFSA